MNSEPSTATADTIPAPKPTTQRRRGFAALDPKRVSEIARAGGLAAHRAGTAHVFTREEAIAAGHKGGTAPHVRRGRNPRKPSKPKEVREGMENTDKAAKTSER